MSETTPASEVPTPTDGPAIQLLAPDQTAGYCDPVTGVCHLPEADDTDGQDGAGAETGIS